MSHVTCGWLGWNVAQSMEHHKGTKHPHGTELHSWYESGAKLHTLASPDLA